MLWRALILICCFILGWPGWSYAAEPILLDVRAEPTGGVKAIATVLFSAPVSVIQSILTDYAHWPSLFDVRMRIADLSVQDGVTRLDVRIAHALLLGERRLVTESQTLPNGELLSDLKGGDFTSYHRRWKLTPAEGEAQTHAEFELFVEIETMAPDWLVAMAMKRDLAAHFRIVQDRALGQMQQLRR
ncbi:MAG: hypothetical protein JW388_1103 [Nitrospira sp.]|nr:hypothetical protein [Nitrospira sp.]